MLVKWADQPRPTISVDAPDPDRALVTFSWAEGERENQRHFHALRLRDGRIVEIHGYRMERDARRYLRI
jgi:hypothetical protein